MPEVADDPTAATLTAWLVLESGDFVGAQSLATVETDTTLLSIEVAEPGVLIKSLVEPGDVVAPGCPLAVLGAPGEVVPDVEKLMVQLGLAVAPEAQDTSAQLRAVPADDPLQATSWLPESHAHVLDEVEDVHLEPVDEVAHVEPVHVAEPVEDAAVVEQVEVEQVEAVRDEDPLVVRRVVGWADTVAEALVDTVLVADPRPAAGLPAARRLQLRDTVNADELLRVVSRVEHVSLTGLVVKAMAVTTRSLPLAKGSSITDIAVQRWTSAGTVAPVVHVAGLMTPTSITATLDGLDARAREGRITPGRLEPATVTLVDLADEGAAEVSLEATAIHPAVLAIGAISEQPVVVDGELTVGSVFSATLSCDAHRIDPVTASRWFSHLCGLLSEPLRFLT